MLRRLLVLLLFLPLASGQVTNEIVTDPEGDVVVGPPDQPGVPIDSPSTDLLALHVIETEARIAFEILLAGEPETEHPVTALQLRMGDMEYRMRGFPRGPAGEFFLESRPTGGEAWDPLGDFPILEPRSGAPGVRFDIDRGLLRDADSNPMLVGRTLDRFQVFVREAGISSCVVGSQGCVPDYLEVRDRMPDQGASDAVYVIQTGGPEGGVLLEVDRPLRATNGAEQTDVFEVYVVNPAPERRTFRLQLENVPTDWVVSLPVEAVTVDAAERTAVPVVVSVPFRHQHGERETFNLTVTGAEDPELGGAITLGMSYLPIPQPAGHHDTVWLHSSEPGCEAIDGGPACFNLYMNTLQEDPNDSGYPVDAQPVPSSSPQDGGLAAPVELDQVQWCARLSPTFRLGILTDPDGEGAFQVPITSPLPVEGTLSGNVVVAGPEDGALQSDRRCHGHRPFTEVLRAAPVPVSFGAGQSATVPLVMEPVADVLHPVDGQDMFLQVLLDAPASFLVEGRAMPTVDPGGTMVLPLREYRPPVTPVTSTAELVIDGHAQRLVNPGGVARFDVVLPDGAEAHRLAVLGTRSDWVLQAPERITSDSPAAVHLAVPDDARDGDVADLVLRATPDDGPPLHARIVVEVDTDLEHSSDDVAARTGETPRNTPMLWPVSVIMLLAVVAHRARTRR